MFRHFVVGLFTAAAIGSAAIAQSAMAAPMNVRGDVVGFSDPTLKVKTREGETVDIALAEGAVVSGVARAAISDIKPSDYVGIASLPMKDGGSGALEVLIFPPAMKGASEGSFGWDLKPKSTMTNATVADTVKGVDGRTVTVTYHGKEKKIAIPEGTPVVTLAPATKADLIPGAVVFVPVENSADNGLTAKQVVVGTNGIVPPM